VISALYGTRNVFALIKRKLSKRELKAHDFRERVGSGTDLTTLPKGEPKNAILMHT
jgi:hypothetical protein